MAKPVTYVEYSIALRRGKTSLEDQLKDPDSLTREQIICLIAQRHLYTTVHSILVQIAPPAIVATVEALAASAAENKIFTLLESTIENEEPENILQVVQLMAKEKGKKETIQ